MCVRESIGEGRKKEGGGVEEGFEASRLRDYEKIKQCVVIAGSEK